MVKYEKWNTTYFPRLFSLHDIYFGRKIISVKETWGQGCMKQNIPLWRTKIDMRMQKFSHFNVNPVWYDVICCYSCRFQPVTGSQDISFLSFFSERVGLRPAIHRRLALNESICQTDWLDCVFKVKIIDFQNKDERPGLFTQLTRSPGCLVLYNHSLLSKRVNYFISVRKIQY